MGPGDLSSRAGPLPQCKTIRACSSGARHSTTRGSFCCPTNRARPDGRFLRAHRRRPVSTSARSPRRTRCPTSTPWAASRSRRSTSSRFRPASSRSSVLTDILRGGQDKVHEAGALIVGGHTVIDAELKYGLAVTGSRASGLSAHQCRRAPGDRLCSPSRRQRHSRDGAKARQSCRRRQARDNARRDEAR